MGASVVLGDVLADDAAAELALPFVFVVPVLDDSLFWIEKISTGDFNAQKLHQTGIIGEVLYHQIIVDAFVVNDAVSVNVNLLTTSSQRVSPGLVQLLDAGGELQHICFPEFSVPDIIIDQIGTHLPISGNVSKAEDHLLGVALQLISYRLRFPQKIIDNFKNPSSLPL